MLLARHESLEDGLGRRDPQQYLCRQHHCPNITSCMFRSCFIVNQQKPHIYIPHLIRTPEILGSLLYQARQFWALGLGPIQGQPCPFPSPAGTPQVPC